MNAVQLIDYANTSGLRMAVVGRDLKLTGNRRAASPGFLQALREHKSEVVSLLEEAPAYAILPYRLRSGEGGQLIDPDGLISAIHALRQHYGRKLDLDHLAGGLSLRLQTLALAFPAAERETQEVALATVRQWKQNVK
ncbi:hypothetical protein [Silvimonas amylolytica]|uniref:TubC N-terminal docking domain-containing protein n=1 Tax=Silvimonas amylolytica TaxID=449663 RepID=A0ABQ2PSF0_9NEIS|nr:hypothetical protein [Silvimonas amylolytica]GGP28316.1 hypothetical protein GCM10010971_41350 [Silvimonas amylolytica]